MKDFTFSDKEMLCQRAFDQHGPYWHIATPGISTELLFTNNEEYCFGMSLMAESITVTGLNTFSFSVMSNHLHNLSEARHKQRCIDFLDHYATRLRRYAAKRGRALDLKDFVCDPVLVQTLQSLRRVTWTGAPDGCSSGMRTSISTFFQRTVKHMRSSQPDMATASSLPTRRCSRQSPASGDVS